jgi:hypothetical protein
MKIELLLTDPFRSQTFESRVDVLQPVRFMLGDALSEHAKVLARDLFREVVVSEGAAAEEEGALAVLKPVAGMVSHTAPSGATDVALVTFEVAWTLTDRKGEVIWQDRLIGEVHRKWGFMFRGAHETLRRFVEEAVRDAFSNSFRALSSSERVRSFAQGTR